MADVMRMLARLAEPAERAEGALALAHHVGAHTMTVFVRDPDNARVLVPAPGFPQTVPGGPTWRAFLSTCLTPGRHRGELAYPTIDATTPVHALVVEDGTAFLFHGGSSSDQRLDDVHGGLPIVAVVLRTQLAATVAYAQVVVARDTARRASTLAAALDTARADLARALGDSARLIEELGAEKEVRERLIGIVGHDLRTPLSAILATAQLALRRGGLPEPAVDAIVRIQRSAQRMARMIAQLLDLTKARLGGGIPIDRKPVDVDAICREAVAEVASGNERSAVRYRGPERPAMLECDPDRITEIVSNLVGNAIKYGDPTRAIDVTLTEASNELHLAVHNEGTPVATELIPFLFNPFRRGNDLERRHDSLGLGLFIVDAIVRAHAGTIEVRSTTAEGTTFTVRLPRA